MKLENLGNISQIIAGQSPPSSEYNKNGVGVPFFQGKADFGLINPVVRSWTTKTTKLAVPNDILISVRAPVGSVNINNVNACIGRGLSAIRVNKEISRDYVFHFLKANEKTISKMGVGSTFTAITQKDLASIKIPLPEKLIDQVRIAEVLTNTKSLIQQRKESIDLLDKFLKGTFLEMFGDPVKNDRKWKKNVLDGIASQITDGEHTTPIRIDSGIKLLSARNIKDGYIDFDTSLDYISEEEYNRIAKRCKPEKNNILMSCSGSVGRVTIINTDEPLALVRSVALIKPISNIVNSHYLQFWMQTSYFQNEVKKGSKTSSQSNIFTGAIKKLPVLLPPIILQNRFSSIVEKAEYIRKQYKASLQELENLFSSLNQRAFKGELNLKKLNVSEKIKEIQKKIEDENNLELSIENILTKSMLQFIKQTEQVQKKMQVVSNSIPNTLLKQIETIERSAKTFQNLPSIPEQLAQSIKSFENIKSISTQLNQENKERSINKLDWDEVNYEMVATWIKSQYKDYHFNSELLIHFLANERVNSPHYHSSEELKTNPKLVESDDLKSFIFSALNNENQFIKLEQFFYNAEKENVELKLREQDYALIKEKELGSGIYFKVVE